MNVELLLWVIVVITIINAGFNIFAGYARIERPTEFGGFDVINGMITLVLMVIVLAG